MSKKKGIMITKKNHFIALLITLVVISVYLFPNLASAVQINIGTDKSNYGVDDNLVEFNLSIDIESGEIVPIQNLTLKINGTMKQCIFAPNSSFIGGNCTNLEIIDSNVSSTSYRNSTRFGYGYGYGGYANTSFGYGYGYGFVTGMTGYTGELRYIIRWNITNENLATGNFTANLELAADGNNTNFTYYAPSNTVFQITRCTSSWSCLEWSTCSNSQQTCTGGWTDSNSCGRTYTGSDTRSCTSSSGSSSSTDSSTTVQTPVTRTYLWSTVQPGDLNIMNVNTDELPVLSVGFKLTTEKTGVVMRVKEASNVPAQLPVTAYSYLEIEKENFENEDVEEATIGFKVAKSWLAENGISEEDIILYRYVEGDWVALETVITGSDDNYIFYEAITPGFSYFAIGSKSADEQDTNILEEQTGVQSPDEESVVSEDVEESNIVGAATGEEANLKLAKTIMIIIVVIIVILVALWHLRKKK